MKTLVLMAALFGAVSLGSGLAADHADAASRKPRPEAGRSCEAAAALKLVGQTPPEDASVKQLTGAKTIRRVAPGQAVTMEYKPDRVTLEIAKGRVVSTACG